VLVVDWNCANSDRHFVTSFVMDKPAGFRGTRGLDGSRHRAFLPAEFTAGMITMEKRVSDTGFPDDFVATMTRNEFGAVAPNYEFLLHVDNAQARWQAFENGAAYFGIVKKAHV